MLIAALRPQMICAGQNKLPQTKFVTQIAFDRLDCQVEWGFSKWAGSYYAYCDHLSFGVAVGLQQHFPGIDRQLPAANGVADGYISRHRSGVQR